MGQKRKKTDTVNFATKTTDASNIKEASAVTSPSGDVEGAFLDEGKFRVSSKKVGLTFPTCNVPPQEMIDWINSLTQIKTYYAATEDHKDGTPHLHLSLVLQTKLETRNCRYYDYKGFHPNWLIPKKNGGWDGYVCKGGKFIHNEYFNWKSNNYKRRKADFDAWKEDVEYNTDFTEVQFPFQLMHLTIPKPDPACKKRHYWIVGPPDWGKTYHIEKYFAYKKIYKAKTHDYPFEGYQHEDLIVYDDYIPKFKELANVSNTYYTRTHVYGKVRQVNTYWKPGHTRTMIICTNEYPKFGDLMPAFEARFNIIDLHVQH